MAGEGIRRSEYAATVGVQESLRDPIVAECDDLVDLAELCSGASARGAGLAVVDGHGAQSRPRTNVRTCAVEFTHTMHAWGPC